MNLSIPAQDTGWISKPGYIKKLYIRSIFNEVNKDEISREVDKIRRKYINRLHEIGLDIIWDGCIGRIDPYTYVLEMFNGVRAIGLARYGEYYIIKGLLDSRPRIIYNKYLNEYREIKRYSERLLKIPVLGAYTLASVLYKKYYISRWRDKIGIRYVEDINIKRETALDLAIQYVKEVVREMSSEGVYMIQLDEISPYPSKDETIIFIETLNEAIKNYEDKILLHILYQENPLENILNIIKYTDVKNIIIPGAYLDKWDKGLNDDIRIGYKILKAIGEYDINIGLGVINPYVDNVEPIQLILDRIKYALKYIDIDRLSINPDDWMTYIDSEVVFKKLFNMVKAVKIIRDEYT